MKMQSPESLVTVHKHTHTDITLTEKLNKFASITKLSSAICYEIKEYTK